MTPRAALNRMWLTLRCLLIATAVPPIAYYYLICATLADDFAGTGGLIIYAVSFVLAEGSAAWCAQTPARLGVANPPGFKQTR